MAEWKTCAKCHANRLLQATFYDGLDRWCAVAVARELVALGQSVPAEMAKAVLAMLDDERKAAQEDQREAGREIRAAEEEARWERDRAMDAGAGWRW